MPRAETTRSNGAGTQPYHMSYDVPSSASSCSSSSTGTPPAKKKHVCPTCDRAFTTSGHLARHSRVHTGERNHKCPFPGCETRCSRQDNLQQHYRIHLSPGSRRSSGRSARTSTNSMRRVRAVSTPSVEVQVAAVPPPTSPPPLETARLYQVTPPDSPPPLATAMMSGNYESSSSRSGADSASPEPNYSMPHPISQSVNVSSATPQYTYRTVPSPYHDEGHDNYGFTSGDHTYQAYSAPNEYPSSHSVNQLTTSSLHQVHTRHGSPASQMASRHSISHISHPQVSYLNSHSGTSTMNPPSPASTHSVPSHNSAPPSPPYSTFDDAGHNTSYSSNAVLPDHALPSPSILQGSYTLDASRFASPPPTLAPIHDNRSYALRRAAVQRHHSAPYIHHPQPMSTDFAYHSQIASLGHGAWKSEHGMRRGLVG